MYTWDIEPDQTPAPSGCLAHRVHVRSDGRPCPAIKSDWTIELDAPTYERVAQLAVQLYVQGKPNVPTLCFSACGCVRLTEAADRVRRDRVQTN